MLIDYKIREIPKSSTDKSSSSPRRSGRYLKSMFPQVKGYGDSKWVIGCYLDIDYPKLLTSMTEDEIIQGCLDKMNEIPPRKKFERKPTSSLYGTLELLSYKLKEDNGNPFIEMLLITDDQKNENFWGEGISFAIKKRRRNRKD